jgi:hypothetical protein
LTLRPEPWVAPLPAYAALLALSKQRLTNSCLCPAGSARLKASRQACRLKAVQGKSKGQGQKLSKAKNKNNAKGTGQILVNIQIYLFFDLFLLYSYLKPNLLLFSVLHLFYIHYSL